jgi:hypothetical protein
MSKDLTLWFSPAHSRNSHDFAYELIGGRHTLLANRRGVKLRIGLMITGAKKHKEGLTRQGFAEYLNANFGVSCYTVNDMAQPLKRMVSLGIMKPHGSGRGTYYTLTNKGETIWTEATKKFHGDKH